MVFCELRVWQAYPMDENVKDPEVESETEPRYKGVAGWLKFFCVVLMLNPLFTLVTLIIEAPLINRFPGFTGLK